MLQRLPADAYAESGEFIDVLSQDAWRALGAPIAEALRRATPRQEPGAGTGLGTLLVAGALPDAEVIAVEPAPILRAVLLSLLAEPTPAGYDAVRRDLDVVVAAPRR
jgi:hypothetical protein